MRTADIVDFVLLAALWGASFLFMRVAAPEFGPVPLMLMRCAIGALTLIPILWWVNSRGARTKVSGLTDWTQAGIVGVINSAIPFSLFAGAALFLSAGMLSIVNGTAPFWGALVGLIWFKDRLTRSQLIGMLIGFAGVFVLVLAGPPQPAATTQGFVIGVLMVLLATVFYGISANYAKRYLSNANALANATGSQIGATLVLLIPGILLWPDINPDSYAWMATVLLGTFCTGLAYILYFRLIKNLGPTQAVTVTFAIPAFGMFWGALILGETVNLAMIGGAVAIIAGCALTTGLIFSKHQTNGGGNES